MATALVTGATSGIGLSFTKQLAARGDDLVLVARDVERMEALKADLEETCEVSVEILRADLSVRADVDAVAARLEDPARPVEIFVNNAGFALHDSLLTTDTALHERAFDVMVKAVFLLGGAAARAMKARHSGTIIITGSAGAFLNTGNYSAIKAWANGYSASLYNELKGTGVHVMCLAPGWVKTEFHQRGNVKATTLPDVVFADPDDVAREALEAAKHKQVLFVPTRAWRTAVFLADHVAPRGLLREIARRLNKSRR